MKIRANRASEVCTSSQTRSRLTVGNSSRVCRVVEATIVPAVTVTPLPVAMMPNPLDTSTATTIATTQ